MKPIDQEWHEYIMEVNNGYSKIIDYIGILSNPRLQKYNDSIQKLSDAYTPLLSKFSGPVKYRQTPFIIIKERLPMFSGRDNYGEYGFRAQCLITGSVSKWIELSEYNQFNIDPEWQNTGGPYLEKQHINDSLEPIYSHYINLYRDIINKRYNVSVKINKNIKEHISSEWFFRYGLYLNSSEWQQIRSKVIEIDFESCTKCGDTDYLQVHHTTYDNVGRENIDELITLCRSCHADLHNMDYHERKRIERSCLDREGLVLAKYE